MSCIISRGAVALSGTPGPRSKVPSSIVARGRAEMAPHGPRERSRWWDGRRIVIAAISLFAVAACGGVSEVTRDRVERSETVVRQAEQTVGNSEHGALELQSAKDTMGRARRALEDDKGEAADRYAQQAQLDAELAIAKSQSAAAREAADELMASIQTLRREAARPPAGSGQDELQPSGREMPPHDQMQDRHDRMPMQDEMQDETQDDQMGPEMREEMEQEMPREEMQPQR